MSNGGSLRRLNIQFALSWLGAMALSGAANATGPFWDQIESFQREIAPVRTERTRALLKNDSDAMSKVQAALRDRKSPEHAAALAVAADTLEPAWFNTLLELAPKEEEGAAAYILNGYLDPKHAKALAENGTLWLKDLTFVDRAPAAAVQVLRWLASPLTVATPVTVSGNLFEALLHSRSYEVRIQAVETLAARASLNAGPPESGRLLASASREAPYQLRLAALHAAVTLPEGQRPPLGQLLLSCMRDSNPQVRALCKALKTGKKR